MLSEMASKARNKFKEKKTKATKPPKLTLKCERDNTIDLEDSGVHLDEPLTPQRSWDAEFDEKKKLDELFDDSTSQQSPAYTPTSSSKHLMNQSTTGQTGSQTDTLCQELRQKCSTSRTTAQGHPASRVSKSESPQPLGSVTISKSHSSTTHTEYTYHSTVKMTRSADRLMPGSATSPDTPEGKDGKKDKVNFTFGDENDSEEETSKTSVTQGATYSRSSSGKEKDHRRGRFKKILRPLRRSHSAGCTKDVPAHALFLRHEIERRKTQPESRAVERGSMDRGSSDSDAEEHQEKKGKKKKSLAKDVKEKLSFLRRRHTDTSLSSKASKDRPTADSISSWSKSFDNLLQDKHGLELFREFLRTEFSEENVEFWIACEEFRNVKSNKLGGRAQQIFTDFVAIQAPREINLDSKTRQIVANNMSTPNRQTFEQAQKRIQALMEKDSYPRFLASEVYQDLLADYKITT